MVYTVGMEVEYGIPDLRTSPYHLYPQGACWVVNMQEGRLMYVKGKRLMRKKRQAFIHDLEAFNGNERYVGQHTYTRR